jgi:hypothetical protein
VAKMHGSDPGTQRTCFGWPVGEDAAHMRPHAGVQCTQCHWGVFPSGWCLHTLTPHRSTLPISIGCVRLGCILSTITPLAPHPTPARMHSAQNMCGAALFVSSRILLSIMPNCATANHFASLLYVRNNIV